MGALSGITRGLPALAGVLGGIFLYAKQDIYLAWQLPVGVFAVVWILRLIGSFNFPSAPRMSMILMEPWVLSAVCVAATCTLALFWITLSVPQWFALDKEKLEMISGAMVGAITTYLATVWTDDLEKSAGPFMPSSIFRKVVAEFSALNHFTGDTKLWKTCNADYVNEAKIDGWGVVERWKRAAILSEFLKTP